MDVRLPDGTIIRGVPDGMSKADLTAKLKGNGIEVAALEDKRPPLMKSMQDMVLGAVRGAGSIGATIMAPFDMARDKMDGVSDKSLTSLVTGGKPALTRNQQRRQDMTDATESLGADPSSFMYGAGKVLTEVAGTMGAGGAIANTAARIPGVAQALPGLLQAVRTGGMTGGNLPTRMVGGAVNGGVSAGMVNPEDAAMGAGIGGALPGALKVAGAVGQKVGSVIRGPQQTPELAAAVQSAQGAGYVIPPTQAKPSLLNRTLEGFSGKITTAQNASAKNQAVTNRLASQALGLPTGTQITPDVLTTVRQQAGQAYNAIGQAGVITPGRNYAQALDNIAAPHLQAQSGFPNAKASPVIDLVESLRSPSFDASSAVAKIKELRSAADDAYRTGNTDIGRASKAAAKALEDAIEQHLTQTGAVPLLQSFRDARQLIAKTYTVEKALNAATGTVDARKLAAQLQKGKPLSGDLRTAAEFAGAFPKAAQATEGMGSLPQTSPLDWALGGGMAASTANPLMLASVLARPAARALTLSPLVQRGLVQAQPNALQRIMAPDLAGLLYRGAPVGLTADR